MSSTFSGGLTVTKEMKGIMKRPGYLTSANGGQRLRDLYVAKSSHLDPTKLSDFGLGCFVGALDQITTQVETGTAPDLKGTETPYEFGYATLIVAGAQRVQPSPGNREKLQHLEVLQYLASRGLSVDVEDIAGLTALAHAVTGASLQVDLARALLQLGADPNHRSRYGEVPIFGACQRNHTAGVDLLMEFGADLDIEDADGVSPTSTFPVFGPQVTATIRKWILKREGKEAPRLEKRCDSCAQTDIALKNCGKCHVARYCSVECQRKHWPTHKKTCQPFTTSNTVTLKPHYIDSGSTIPASTLTRQLLGVPTEPTPSAHKRAAHVPKISHEPKNLVIKVQVPSTHARGPSVDGGDLFVYTKKRDLVCVIRKKDNAPAYESISAVVRSKGVGGAKAYFAAELKSKDELIVKISEVLAEQPF